MLCYSHSTEKHSDAQGRLSDLAKMYSGKVNSLLTSFFTKMYFSPIKSTNQKIKKKKTEMASVLRSQQHRLYFWVM